MPAPVHGLGIATVVCACFLDYLLPDSPMSAKCGGERRMMVERVRHNETGIQNKVYKRYQAMEALADPLVWYLVHLIIVCNLVIGGLGVFSNLLISQFGFSLLQTQLPNISQGVITIIVMTGGAQVSQKWGQTCFNMLLWTIPPVTGTCGIHGVKPTASNANGLLVTLYCTQFLLTQGNMIILLVSRNIARQTKKSTTLSMVFFGWAASGMSAPQIFQAHEAPRHLHGFIAHLCVYGVHVALVIATRMPLMCRNAKKWAATVPNEAISHNLAFQDLSDTESGTSDIHTDAVVGRVY